MINKTKIVATFGPAIASLDMLRQTFQAGVDVIRLNFSHGTLDEKAEALALIRTVADELKHPIAIMGDLCGQKIRLTRIEGGKCEINAGDLVTVERDLAVGNAKRLGTNYPDMITDVQVGHRVLIDDGALQFVCEAKSESTLTLRCNFGGVVSDRKGVNLPDTTIKAPSLTKKDFEDLEWMIQRRLDFVCVSFVRSPNDVLQVRERIRAKASGLLVISKIEKREAIARLDEIISVSHGVMVARGDLGVEVDLDQVPLIQKDITRRCQELGKPCIIATQMLQSMVENPTPTRAEVNDVANAVFDAADAIMLSAETAVGRHPIAAVQSMHRVTKLTEDFIATVPRSGIEVREAELPVTSSVAISLANIARELKAKVVALWTVTGNTVRLLSKNRLPMPIIGMADDPQTCRHMAMQYGVIPIVGRRSYDLAELLHETDQLVVDRGLAKEGDLIIIAAPQPLKGPGDTSVIYVHLIGDYREANLGASMM